MLDVISSRKSVRKYDGKPITGELRAQIEVLLARERCGFFGGRPRFALVEREAAGDEKGAKLGTYGFIRGARAFVAGVIARQAGAEIDYGYALERIILELTAMGLGTCWLGGTFSRAEYGGILSATDDEFVPAVTPVGVAAERRGKVERLVRWGAKADARLAWEELFFDHAPDRPLNRESAGDYADALDAIRRGPSASNKQPWRVIRDADRFHLVLKRTPGYAKLVPAADLQQIDMGIAMCHFEAAAAALKLPGAWHKEAPEPSVGALGEYIVTWASSALSAPK